MSSHFNYEIDEKALRQKMLNQKATLDNDAWQRYETHRNQAPKNSKIESAFKTIKFSINKNVILPLIFGSVIIAFSFLLFNFISINTTKKKVEIKTSKQFTNPINKASNYKPKLVAAIVKKDTLTHDSLLIANTTSISTTPTIQVISTSTNNITVLKTENTNTTSINNSINIPSGESLYPSPSIKTTPIATSSKNIKYSKTGETIYFIKLAYTINGEIKEAYLRKSSLEPKINQMGTRNKTKPETMETSPMPSLIDNSQEKELELR
jgi:hypothetical protein